MQGLPVLFLSAFLSLGSCANQGSSNTATPPAASPVPGAPTASPPPQDRLQTGAEQTGRYVPLLQGKRVAMVVNQTSVIGNSHEVDSLLALGVNIKLIYAPEHGFRGDADAGAHVSNATDTKTGLPIISLYGKNKKPTAQQLQDIDVVLFDIQDVGARFYTYISTMHYVMEACAEQNKQVMVLDRPNPNGYYVDGPVLEPKYKSFVGMHPIPVVHGLTVGELAQMINGEKWLAGQKSCQLTVIPVAHYTHRMRYSLPVKPSPNLPNDLAIQLYPSICLFEGTQVSVGRGTDWPFQVIGSPYYTKKAFSFTPRSVPGATNPPFLNQVCYGKKLAPADIPGKFSLAFVLDFYQNSSRQQTFFNSNNFFNTLAGTDKLQAQIRAGRSEAEIRASWQPALQQYKALRRKYLLYPDFE
jgi:uncharacterized protein YbbC (DUF1343 family)